MCLIVFKGLPHTTVSLRVWALRGSCHEYSSTDVVSDNAILLGFFHLAAFLVFLTQPGHMAGLRDRAWTIVCTLLLVPNYESVTLQSVREALVCTK